MNAVPILVRKDMQRRLKSPFVILGFLLFPLVFTFIMGLVFGRTDEETLPAITVLTADKDQSFLSDLLIAALTQGELKDMLTLKEVGEEEGRRLLDRGKASALLVIPEGFSDAVWNGTPTELELWKNPSEQFLPQIVEEITDTAALLLSALQSVFAEEIDVIRGYTELDQVPDSGIAALAVQFKYKFEAIEEYVLPPAIAIKQVTVSDTQEPSVEIGVAGQILPAIAIMFLLFICNVIFEDVLREKESGTLLRMTVSRMRLFEFIWSKITASLVVGVICTLVIILYGKVMFSIHWGGFGLLMLIVLALNVLASGFFALFYSFIRTERQASAVLTSVILVMSVLGGSMVPVSAFPPVVQQISRFTLNYWGIAAFRANMAEQGLSAVAPIAAGMLILGFCLSVMGAHFMKKTLRGGLFR